MTDAVTTWSDAKIAAWEHLVPTWPTDELGPLQIAPWGWESPRFWVVTVTNPVTDGVWVKVTKADGSVEELVWTEWIDLRLRMGKVGDWSKAPA